MDWWALGGAAALCLAMAAAEGALGGSELTRWLATLQRPRLYAPMWLWVAVAVATYLVQGAVAYRLLAAPLTAAGAVALAMLVAVMAGNVAYNVVLVRTRSARAAWSGLLWFLLPLAALQAALAVADGLSFWLHLAYAAWVVGYDLPVMRALYRRNAGAAAPRPPG